MPYFTVSWKTRIEDRGSRIEDRGSRIEDRGSGIGDRGSRIEDRGSRINDRGSSEKKEKNHEVPSAQDIEEGWIKIKFK